MKVGHLVARSDDLTLGQLLDVELAAGKPWPQINPFASACDAHSIVVVMFGAEVATAARDLPADVSSWVEVVEDDLPDTFRDSIPRLGGRSFDDYIVAFANPKGFGWPPDVTRRQRIRDLDLLLAAFQ